MGLSIVWSSRCFGNTCPHVAVRRGARGPLVALRRPGVLVPQVDLVLGPDQPPQPEAGLAEAKCPASLILLLVMLLPPQAAAAAAATRRPALAPAQHPKRQTVNAAEQPHGRQPHPVVLSQAAAPKPLYRPSERRWLCKNSDWRRRPRRRLGHRLPHVAAPPRHQAPPPRGAIE